MSPMPRNRSAKAATPRRNLVLRLNQIRCAECHASARVKYLRPFVAFQTEEGIIVLCRTCQDVSLPPSGKAGQAGATAGTPLPFSGWPLRAA